MNDIQTVELAAQNGRTASGEIGTSGLEVFYGQIMKADNTKLNWPDVYELFNKYLRRDPQVRMMGNATSAMASKVNWYWELVQEDPTPAEEAFLEFLHTIWDDLPGGQRKLIDTYNHYIPMGWLWFENVPARRNGMRAAGTDWASVYEDGLVGFRDVAFRDHSSFSKWDIDDSSGNLRGFYQQDWPNPEVVIPLDRSTHVTLGDPTSPEGLSPFEALWRLESFMYNLEIILGIGSERSAGYMLGKSESEKLTNADHAKFREVARALMSAQEGNVASVPAGLSVEIIDTPFASGPNTLEAIKYYGHLKAQVLGIQWMSLSLTSDAGSNASMLTSANMWLTSENSRMSGAARMIGEQLATQLRNYNRAQFGSVKRLPVLKSPPVDSGIDLLELGQFMQMISPILDITEEDLAAVRRKSQFLPEIEISEIQDEDEVEETDEVDEIEETPQEDEVEEEAEVGELTISWAKEDGSGSVTSGVELAHPVAIGKNQPTVTDEDDLVDLDDDEDIERMIRRIERLDPLIGDLLRAEASDE